ncbi:MAG: helix-turn-helix domain-containing protein [Patescibacteria group bacterium]
MSLIQKLVALGLSDKEAAIYVSLIESGDLTASELADKTDIVRSSIYPVIESLTKKGLARIAANSGVMRYTASSPEKLSEIAKEKADKFRMLKQDLEALTPELRQEYKGAKFRPKITLLEGKEGMIEGFEDTFNSKEKLMRVASSAEKIFKTLPGYLPKYVLKRHLYGLAMKGLHPTGPAASSMIKMNIMKLDQSVLVPKELYKFPCDLAIFDDNVAYMSHEHRYAIKVHSKEIAEVMKAAFDLAWNNVKRMNIQP